MREFTVIYEQGESNWGAIIPDLPGCVSVGDTFEDIQRNVREAVELYLGVLADRGEPIPEARHRAGNVAVSA